MSKKKKTVKKDTKKATKETEKKVSQSKPKRTSKPKQEDEKPKEKLQGCSDIEKVKKSLELEGYPLELETYLKFWNDKWAVGLQWPFQDPDTTEYRNIDISVSKEKKLKSEIYNKLEFALDIECKKQRNAVWIFHEWYKRKIDGNKIISSLPYCKYTPINTQANPNEDICELIGRSSHQSPDNHSTHAILGMSVPLKKDSGKRGSANNLLYDACQKVRKCTEYYHKSAEKSVQQQLDYALTSVPILFWRRYSVVVFDGCMYKIQPVNNEFVLKETPYVQYEFRTGGRNYLIDIVRKDYLPKFLSKIETELELLEQLVNGIIRKNEN